MAENMNHSKSASTSGSDDGEGWELECCLDSNKEMFAKLVARMDALETENKLLKEQKGLGLAVFKIKFKESK
jgi:hypothetical protein